MGALLTSNYYLLFIIMPKKRRYAIIIRVIFIFIFPNNYCDKILSNIKQLGN